MNSLEDLMARAKGFDPQVRIDLEQRGVEFCKSMKWVPNPGPQTEAYFSTADELLYGGEPGGGKTDLVIGLSITEHQRSLVLRRTNKEAEKLVERYKEIIGHTKGLNEQRGVWRLGRKIIDMGGCQNEDDKQKRKGVPHDLKAFDELPDFTRTQYEFIITWNRSTDPNQRCRIVATANPPTNPQGIWVIDRWGPWLDPKHPKKAESGEIRWYLRLDDGSEVEVDGRGPYEVKGKEVFARSRTFIRAKLEDNIDLARTNYSSTLAASGKEMQALAGGDFAASLIDAPNQVCPSSWIRAAMKRWKPRPATSVPMCAMGVDASGGGNDPMTIARRYDGWFDEMIIVPAKEIPQERAGAYGTGVVVSYRRDNATVVIDLGGGWGLSMYEQCHKNDIECVGYKGAAKSSKRTRERQKRFKNVRAEAMWRFREALDPNQPGGSPIDLPDDPILFADLAAPTYEEDALDITIETKEDVCERLGRSTNHGDAVIMCWYAGAKYVSEGVSLPARVGPRFVPSGGRPQVVMGRKHARRR